ncbi:DUF1003 domain-containing protein [Dactylosporangium roseum]|uniref:DUF1003 domain-containing protein n=1 Tax=Dactylosporangium roseum TaxID=47989 RepID=A0ABY5ZC42_9ACTN|nr:DUF1003 domain-containing protein [Dactylosporangium roseum]UWZ39665.1 DUF1003 domain-containing protein [Dactylosporangium roseum]
MQETPCPAPPIAVPENGEHAARRHYLHPANRYRHDHRTAGQRLADSVTGVFGSWRFIVVQTVIVIAWIAANIVAVALRWDPYPFILLNLLFSTQAAYAAPLILLSQNRQADTDRVKAEHDYQVNQLALQYLIAWHRTTHGDDCTCVRDTAPVVTGMLATLAQKL